MFYKINSCFGKGTKLFGVFFSWQLLFCTIDLLCCKYLQYLMRLLTYIGPTGCNTFIYLTFSKEAMPR